MANGTYRYTFNANGGAGAPSAITGITLEQDGFYLATVNLPSGKPSRTYFTFLGWAKSNTATSAQYSAGSSIYLIATTATYTQTLWAVWKAETATVTYNANGGTGAPSSQTVNKNEWFSLRAGVPTRQYYRFLGWATSSTATVAQYQPSGQARIVGNMTLYAVWEKLGDVVSTSNGTIGSAMTLTITKVDNSYTDDITYQFGSATGTIASGTTALSLSWTPPLSLASEIPNASTGTLVITCSTYNGASLVGTTTTSVTLTVPHSLDPTASVSYVDTDPTCLSWGIFVQSRSKLSFVVTASGQQGASITSYSAQVNGANFSSDTWTTDVLLYSGTNTYTVKVTDSRGYQTTVTGTFNVEAYSTPSVALISCDRDDSDPEQVNIDFDFSVASVQSNNTALYSFDYKEKSDLHWTTGSDESLGGYTGTISDFLSSIDQGSEYDIRINVKDAFQTVSTETEVGVSGNVLYNQRHRGGLGLLMKSQADDQLDVGKPSVFHGKVKELYGSTVGSHSASGNYAVIATFDLIDSNVTAPITMEFIRTGDTAPTRITFCFAGGSTLTSFTSNNVTAVYLHYSSVWTLYAGKASSTDKVEILDFHNPWSNSDIDVEWQTTSVSSVPAGSTQATALPVNLVTAYGDLSNTGHYYSHAPSAVNLSASTWKTIAQLALPAGKYIVSGNARFPSNSTGRRTVILSTSSDSSTDLGIIYTNTDKSWSDGSGYNFVGFCAPLQLGSAQTIYLNAWQNSGSALSTYGRLYVMRIA